MIHLICKRFDDYIVRRRKRFEETIFMLKRKVIDQKLKNRSMELTEALEVIRETTEEIKNAINGILEGEKS